MNQDVLDPVTIATAPGLNPVHKVVLQVLQALGWQVSIYKLSSASGLSDKAVQRAITQLEQNGVIECVEKQVGSRARRFQLRERAS